jgi:hypothetical protein
MGGAMRIILLHLLNGAIYTCLIATSFSKDIESYSAIMKGDVESVQINHDSDSSISLNIKLKLEFFNNGKRPLILFNAKSPILVGISLAKNESDFVAGKILAKDYYGPSADFSAEWDKLRGLLNKSKPPANLVRILMPNQSFPLNESVSIALPINSRKNAFIPEREDWETIRAISVVWIRVSCEIWPLNIESPGHERTKLVLGKSLQKRWHDSGLLLLNPIISEPIELDLRKAQPLSFP